MKNLTRRELAEHAAAELAAGRTEVIGQLAAYLVEARRTREAGLIARDIESALARRGIVVAHVASAHELDVPTKQSVEALLKRTFSAKTLHLHEIVEPQLLGGIKLTAADKELDATSRRVLQQLKSVKV